MPSHQGQTDCDHPRVPSPCVPLFLLLLISKFCSSYPCHVTVPLLSPPPGLVCLFWTILCCFHLCGHPLTLGVLPWLHVV